jgi:hypothetical protein
MSFFSTFKNNRELLILLDHYIEPRSRFNLTLVCKWLHLYIESNWHNYIYYLTGHKRINYSEYPGVNNHREFVKYFIKANEYCDDFEKFWKYLIKLGSPTNKKLRREFYDKSYTIYRNEYNRFTKNINELIHLNNISIKDHKELYLQTLSSTSVSYNYFTNTDNIINACNFNCRYDVSLKYINHPNFDTSLYEERLTEKECPNTTKLKTILIHCNLDNINPSVLMSLSKFNIKSVSYIHLKFCYDCMIHFLC